jgi:hypothetical protein
MLHKLSPITLFISLTLPLTTLAQKNFFEVPSGEHVETHEFFAQTQVTATRDDINAMAAVTYGVGRRADIGITFNQWDFQRGQGIVRDSEHPEQSPDILINAQKAFVVNNYLMVAAGLRSGINGIGGHKNVSFANFNYVTSRFELGMHALVAGGYLTNRAYQGAGTHVGIMAGVDLALFPNAVHFIADFTSGNSALSVTDAGFEVQFLKDWHIAIGVQVPHHGADTPVGGMLQISWN